MLTSAWDKNGQHFQNSATHTIIMAVFFGFVNNCKYKFCCNNSYHQQGRHFCSFQFTIEHYWILSSVLLHQLTKAQTGPSDKHRSVCHTLRQLFRLLLQWRTQVTPENHRHILPCEARKIESKVLRHVHRKCIEWQ